MYIKGLKYVWEMGTKCPSEKWNKGRDRGKEEMEKSIKGKIEAKLLQIKRGQVLETGRRGGKK